MKKFSASKVYNVFTIEEARIVYRLFSMFERTKFEKASILTLIELNAILPNAKDALQFSI